MVPGVFNFGDELSGSSNGWHGPEGSRFLRTHKKMRSIRRDIQNRHMSKLDRKVRNLPARNTNHFSH